MNNYFLNFCVSSRNVMNYDVIFKFETYIFVFSHDLKLISILNA